MAAVVARGTVSTLRVVQPLNVRAIATTSALPKIMSGRYKRTRFRTQMLTYEMAQKPEAIGVRKSWMTWHTHNLLDFVKNPQTIVAQDEIVRRFLRGIWTNRFIEDEIVIKRRGNVIIAAGLIDRYNSPSKVYWMIGFTEELLSHILKQPFRLELQSVGDRREAAFKYV